MNTYQRLADQINKTGVTATYDSRDAVNAQAAQDAIWGKISAHDVEMACFEVGSKNISDIAACAAVNACCRLFGDLGESVIFELN